MTLRNVLKRKAAIFSISLVTIFVVSTAAVLLAGSIPGWVLVAAFSVLLFLPLAILHWYFRCPRCGGSIGSLVAYFGPLRFLAKPVKFCPRCGAGFDEQVAP